MNLVTFSLIIDDIVFPDGQTAMGVLGGGGPQTAFGMRLWADRVGLVSGVGADLPAAALDWLGASVIDTGGLRFTDWPTLRAWQVLEEDGRRTQLWRIPGPAIGAQLGRSLERLPPSYRSARGFHLGVHPEEPGLDFIASLRDLEAIVSVEPFRIPERSLTDRELRALLSAGQIFSPNRREAEALVGPGDPLDQIERLAQAGAEIVALRQGSMGATVHRVDTGETWQIPAVNVPVVDPTGAGNAFCGGFLAGWLQTGELRRAGLCGAVAASFLVEQVGLPAPRAGLHAEAKRRFESLEPRVRRVR
jgi:sugar/nucleoside kinase (ribokinase family)